MKSFLICGNSSKPMKLNESESTSGRYILQGLFAGPFGVENRNKRIYEVDEYMKHLQYLRDDIKKGEPLLGELDHPEDRFEVKLKEASHRVLDLWYDKATNTIQGKIELLNTPNGKLAQSLVDQGIPLHISSRAAGTVNSDKTVSIQQIYTFDLVCKPGFAGAVLHRVNESDSSNKYTDNVYKFLAESERAEARNAAPQFGMLNEDVSITEVKTDPNIRKEAKEIAKNNNDDINNMEDNNTIETVVSNAIQTLKDTFPFIADVMDNSEIQYSEDPVIGRCYLDGSVFLVDKFDVERIIERFGVNAEKVIEKMFITALMDNDWQLYSKQFDEEGGEAYNTLNNEVNSIIREANNVGECDNTDPNCNKKQVSEADDDETDEEEPTDGDKTEDGEDKEENEEEGVEIISVRAETSDGVEIVDVDADGDKTEDDEEKEEPEDDSESEPDGEDNENTDENESADECKKDDKKDMILDCKELKERKQKFLEDLDEQIDAIKSKSERRKADESYTIQKYPMSRLLNESNFAGFMGLNESQKSNVINYLADNGIVDIDSVNESWRNGIEYRQETEVWLKYAPKEYRELFESASDSVKESIRNTASFIVFESQHDVNVFWENTGLVSSAGSKMLNEQFVATMPKIVEPVSNDLPYGKDFIDTVAAMAASYNG